MGLDIWQIKRQLAYLAEVAVWGDAPGAVVYTGGAANSEDLEGNFAPGSFRPDGPVPNSLPFARVSCLGFSLDTEQPSRIDVARFNLWSTAGGDGGTFDGSTGASAPNFDTHGLNMEDGSLRASSQPQGKSAGRSVDELIGRFLEQLSPPGQFTDSVHGFQGHASRAEAVVPVAGVQVLTRVVSFDVFNAALSRYYHSPRAFGATASGGGSVALAWSNPPTRYDTYQNVLRRGSTPGAAAPTTISGGTGISITGGVLGTSATDPGHSAAQVFNYSLFHVYSEVTTGDRVSAAATATVTVT